MKYFDEYFKEFNLTKLNIQRRIIAGKRRGNEKLNPYNISNEISSKLLTGNPRISIGERIRKFHDFYGWKAKDREYQFGLCSGAYFRSIDYLNINPKVRDGSRTSFDKSYGVHIEHTIPVQVIKNILINLRKEIISPRLVFETIIKFSMCTGITRFNKKHFVRKSYNSKHPDIRNYNTTVNSELVFPFSRYIDEAEIIFMPKQIKIDKTIQLKILNGWMLDDFIFNWENHEKYYQYQYNWI